MATAKSFSSDNPFVFSSENPFAPQFTHDGFPAVQNADGTQSTEISITVTEAGLNNGRPTNIPSLWERNVLPQAEAVKKAIKSGRQFPSFNSIDEAVQAAIARSNAGGAGAPDAPDNPLVDQKENAGSAFVESGLRSMANTILAIPSATGDILAATVAAPRLLPGGATFGELFTEEQSKFPASLIRAIPRPTVEGIEAGARSLPALMPGGETFSARKQTELFNINAENERLRTKFPFAASAGDVAGDVASIVLGRLPFAKSIAKAESKLAGKARALIPQITDPGLRAWTTTVLNSPKTRALARGASRSVETGLEAAALDIINGGDNLEIAAYAAGGQAGGSLALSALTKPTGIKLAVGAIAFGSVLQVLRDTVPGDQGNWVSAVGTGFEKITLAIGLGVMSGAIGAGRLRGGVNAKNFPKIMDAISTTPRAATLSMLQDYVSAKPQEQQHIERVLNNLSTDPEFYGPDAMSRLAKALEAGNFIDEIRKIPVFPDLAAKQKMFENFGTAQ